MEKTDIQKGMNHPKYSVLMAVYAKDNPDWFGFAVDSMLNQTLKPDEIVIVKDGPLTAPLEAVISSRVNSYPALFNCVQLSEGKGLGEALRVGVLACKNEWIARMDSDDYSAPERCETQFAAQERTGADIIGSNVCEFEGSVDNIVANRVFPEKHADIVKYGKRRTPFCHPSVMMRKSQILAAGNYRTALYYEDYDLFVRMLMLGLKGYTVPQALVFVRVSVGFYARRGGMKYLKPLLECNNNLLDIGWMNIGDYIVRSMANVVSCLSPGWFRAFIYRTFLRS